MQKEFRVLMARSASTDHTEGRLYVGQLHLLMK